MESGNFALDAMILGPEWKTWEHKFVDKGTPYCDVDNKVICSPAFKSNLTKKQLEIIRGKNIHEAGHARYTPPGNTAKGALHFIINALEDLRIEKIIGEQVPIFSNDLRKLNEHILGEIVEEKSYLKNSHHHEAIIWMMAKTNNYKVWEPREFTKTLIDQVQTIFEQWRNKSEFSGIEKLAKEIHDIWKKEFDTPKKDSKEKANLENSEKSNLGEAGDFDSEFSEESIMDEVLQKEFDYISKPSDENDYPRYTGNDIFKVATESECSYNTARSRISNQIGRISQYIESSLKCLTNDRVFSGAESGAIDKRRLHAIATGGKNIFQRTTRGISINSSITILIDASGSMSSRIEGVKSFTIAIAEAFERLKIDFEILGFTTGNKRISHDYDEFREVNLITQVYKLFDENYNACKFRLGSYTDENSNADGESLRIAWDRNKQQRGSKRHIVFVLSDGKPACSGVMMGTMENHLMKTIKDVRKEGGEVYAFGIGTEKPRDYYGEENFVYVENIKNLGTEFFKKLQKVIAK